MTVVVEVDLRARLAAARDQGRRPTCLAFAVSGAHEAHQGVTDYLSPEALFYYAVQRSHRDFQRGLSKDAVAGALLCDGQPFERDWPYLVTSPVHTPRVLTTVPYKAKLSFRDRTSAEIRALVFQGQPVLLVLGVTKALHRPGADAIVRGGQGDVVTVQKHALLAVGWGACSDGPVALVRNSWGLRWGDAGHAWLLESYLSQRLQTTGTVESCT